MNKLNENLYNQDTEISVLSCLIQNISEKTFIDVGTEKGEISKWFIQNHFVGCLFEPLPIHHSELKLLIDGTDNRFFPFAIDDHDHQGILHIATDSNGQTMDYFHSLQRLENDKLVKHTLELKVDCRSINSLIDDSVLEKSVGVFKTDTEGNDLKVLSGMSQLNAEVLICEFFTEGMYAGWEDAHPEKIIAEANKLGFGHYIAIKRRKGIETVAFSPSCFHEQEWGNLIFVKNPVFTSSIVNLLKIKKRNEIELLDKIEMLQDVCDERENLIKELHQIAAERLVIIEEMK